MNKKILLVLLAVLVIGAIVIKINAKDKVEAETLNVIKVNDLMSEEVIEEDGIKIRKVSLNDIEENLYFRVSSEEELESLNITVVLINTQKENSNTSKTVTIKNLKDERIVKIDFDGVYSKPERIKFALEK